MKKGLIKGSLFITVASFIVKLLSFIYKIPFQQIMGDFGFYTYQLLYPLFAIFVSYGTYALPLSFSQYMVKEKTMLNGKGLNRLFLFVFIPLAVIAIALSGIWSQLFNDEQLRPLFLILGLVIIISPILGLLRGWMQSQLSTVIHSSLSLIIEQLIRVILIFIILYLYHQMVITDIYEVTLYSYLALLIGMFVSCLYLLNKKRLVIDTREASCIDFQSIFKQSLLLLMSSSVLVMFQLVDSLTITHLLQRNMDAELAYQIKGIYDRSYPLIQGATFFITPLLSVLIPHYALGEEKKLHELMNIVLLLTLPVAIGLMLVFPLLNNWLFKDQALTIELTTHLAMVFFYPIILTFIGLNQHNNRKFMFLIIGGVFIKLFLNVLFIPQNGILGAALGSVGASVLIVLLLVIENRRYHLFDWSNISKIGVGTLIMALSVDWFPKSNTTASLFILVFIGAITYCLSILILNPLQIRESIKKMMSSFKK